MGRLPGASVSSLGIGIPARDLEVRTTPGGHTIAQLFMHLASNRLAFLEENVPDAGFKAPPGEWVNERDPEVIARFLDETARAVREVARDHIAKGRAMAIHYDHPLLFLQHMIWHDGYHHGQIKLALQLAGRALSNETIGRGTWGVWMRKA